MRVSAFVASAAAVLMASSAVADDFGIGCFGTIPGFTSKNTDDFQTSDSCGKICKPLGMMLQAISYKNCWCGSSLPPRTALAPSTASCNTPCPGYGNVFCGSSGGPTTYWTIFGTGLNTTPITFPDDPAAASTTTTSTSSQVTSIVSSATKSSSIPPSVVTVAGGQTIIVTASASSVVTTETPSVTPAAAASGPSTAGIAAGVVVGVIVLAALAGGGFLYVRRQRRRELEEEHKRQVAISAFTAGGKPGSGASSHTNDTRLDPVMAQRRMSDGSIADNQDYSRRILKVTNA